MRPQPLPGALRLAVTGHLRLLPGPPHSHSRALAAPRYLNSPTEAVRPASKCHNPGEFPVLYQVEFENRLYKNLPWLEPFSLGLRSLGTEGEDNEESQ